MKRHAMFLLVLLMTCTTTSSLAQDPAYFNRFALSVSHGGNTDGIFQHCLEAPAGGVYQIQLLISRPTVSMIGGFECRLWTEGGVQILGKSFPVNAIDVGTYGNLIVGFGEPLVTTHDATVLATLDVLIWVPDNSPMETAESSQKSSPVNPFCYKRINGRIYMGPARPHPSIEGFMVFIDAGDDDNELLRANYHLEYEDGLAMTVNAWEPIVATEAHSWGTMKALYR